LPNELPYYELLTIVEEFIEPNFIKLGLPAVVAIHKGINIDVSQFVQVFFVTSLPEGAVEVNPIRLDHYNSDMEAINATIGDMGKALRILNEGA
jgi:hypothetical protein